MTFTQAKELKYKMILQYSEEDRAWIITFPELPGCMMDGETPEEALKQGLRVKDNWLEVAIDSGWEIPLPGPYLNGATEAAP